MADGLDLHADAEGWSDNRDDESCECCGGPRVVFIPVWADGGGILTPEEIEDALETARVNVVELGRREEEGRLPELPPHPDSKDVVMRIDAYSDGTFRAVILARGGVIRQAYTRYGKGSVYTGAAGWRHGLGICRRTRDVTTDAERERGLSAWEGEPGVLNFRTQPTYRTGSMSETRRLGLEVRDRTVRTSGWMRQVRRKPGEPVGDPPGFGSGEDEAEG